MRSSVKRPQNNVCHRSDDAALLIALTNAQDQQNIVYVIDHTSVEQGELLTKCSNFYIPPPVRGIIPSEFHNADYFQKTTPCLKKNKQNYFCYNYVKLPPNLKIFGTKMANCLKLYEVHLFSTSPKNLCQCTTVLNADVPNCHITL